MSSWLNELLEIKNNETKTINDPFLRFSLTEPEWYDYMLNLYSTPETREYKQGIRIQNKIEGPKNIGEGKNLAKSIFNIHSNCLHN